MVDIDYNKLFRSSPDLYLILDNNFIIIEVSDAYCSATLVKRDDIIGRCIFDVFPDNPDDNTATGVNNLRASLSRVITNKKADALAVQKYDIRRPESEGGGYEERYWSPVNYPILDDKDTVKYIVHRAEDVTEYIRLKTMSNEQIQATNKIRNHSEKIENEIFQRAQEIQEVNKQLRIANEMAQEASRAKSAFLATMSHEIRTPLNGVIGMTSILLDSNLTLEQKEWVETIRLSGEALLAVINDILDFSKIESGHIELESIDFNLRDLIDDALEILAGQVHKKGVAIGAIIDSDVPNIVKGDPSRVRQVLINLLNNASKFTSKGEIIVKVNVESTDDQLITMMFQVIDTGIGISGDVQKRLFQPFMQGDRSTSRKYGGTGLGLALSRRIIELMNGSINLKSKIGEGSNFYFTIIFNKSASDIERVQEFAPVTKFENMRVLCVDDTDVNLEIISHQTNSWGMRCDVAKNASDALVNLREAISDNDQYKLLMIDYNMPDIDGVDLIGIIRKMPEYSKTPIILLSSLGISIKHENFDALDQITSLTKPVRQSKLFDTIVSLFNSFFIENNSKDHGRFLSQKKMSTVKILLAEDNPTNQMVALHLLAKLGHHADVVENGLKVLNALQNDVYDVILMDCQMPEMDGYMTTEFIRKLNLPPSTNPVIIAMTAHALKGDREKCLESGMDDYIAKPINIEHLEKTLNHWIGKKYKNNCQQSDAGNGIIDFNRIHEIIGNNQHDIDLLFDSFINSTASMLTQIKESIETRNIESLKLFVHKLKGSAANCGIIKMSDICHDFEKNIDLNNFKDIDKDLIKLDDCFSQIKVELSRQVNK